jgi:polyisoprenyl-phosphate glycosyltransferase
VVARLPPKTVAMEPEVSISVSVVVPVYSGEKFLRELVQQLDRVRGEWVEQKAPMRLAELILVDDAAVDASPTIVDDLEASHAWVTALHLMRNFGQHAATIAGVLHSSGDWIVTMDEDLQHSPAEIEPLLTKAVLSGADVVYARPSSAVHEARTRDWASSGFKRVMAILTGNANVVHFNSFRLLRGSLARAASSACGHETYFDVALSWFTNRIQFVLLELKDRRFISSGISGYSFSRLLTHARQMLMTSRIKAIRLLGFFGVLIAALSTIGGIAVLVQKIIAPSSIAVRGWPSLMLVSLFFGGFITFMIALILEYISILVLSAHGKPLFFVVDRSSDKTLLEYLTNRLR